MKQTTQSSRRDTCRRVPSAWISKQTEISAQSPAIVFTKPAAQNYFIALCRNDPEFPNFVNYHCVFHQQALAGKAVDFSHVMTLVVKLVNSIQAKAWRGFPSLLKVH